MTYITNKDSLEQVREKVRDAVDLTYPYTYKYPDGTIRVYQTSLRSSDILRIFETGGKNGNGPIPKDYESVRDIGDTRVFIRSQANAHRSKPRRRVVARCNHCFRWVCAGHLLQHKKSHKEG